MNRLHDNIHYVVGDRVLVDAADMNLEHRGRIPCRVTAITNFHTQVLPETGESCRKVAHECIIQVLGPDEVFVEDPVVDCRADHKLTGTGSPWRYQ